MKVLFLDYDGVINKISPEYSTPTRTFGNIMTMAEPELVYRLNLIVDRTDCEIVLSSSWRHMTDWEEAMKLSGVFKKILDATPLRSTLGGSRGHHIKEWLMTRPEVTKYAILDDDADMLEEQQPNFFKTDAATGLTQEIADAVEKHLSAQLTESNSRSKAVK